MAKKSKKTREDDNLDGVRAALESFDVDASVAGRGLDEQIGKFRQAHKLPDRAHHAIRRAIRESARAALGQRTYKTVGHPRDEAATRKLFADLKKAIELHRRIQQFDTWQAFGVTHRERRDGSADPPVLSIDDQTVRVENDIDAIKNATAQTSTLIEQFMDVTSIPKFKKNGGRTILFTYHFIQHFAGQWRTLVGADLHENDLPGITSLLAAALADLKYPLSKSQRLSDRWLSDRIRKQIFRN